MALIKTSLAEAIGTIAFDRDDKRNALSAELIAETISALDEFRTQDARVVVLRSATSGEVCRPGTMSPSYPSPTWIPCPTTIHSSS